MTPAREIAPAQVSYHLPGAATRNLYRKARTVDISLPHPPACRRRNAPSRHACYGSLAGHVAVLAEIMVRAYQNEGMQVPAGLEAACAASMSAPPPRLRVIPGGAG